MTKEQQPIWYLPGPNSQYVEDVKILAREAGLRIIDANVTTDRSNAAESVPEVTLKPAANHADADYVPSKAELLAAHERMLQIRAELDAERDRLHAQAAELEAERARLAELAEKLTQHHDPAPGNPPAVELGTGAAPAVADPAADAKPGRTARAK